MAVIAGASDTVRPRGLSAEQELLLIASRAAVGGRTPVLLDRAALLADRITTPDLIELGRAHAVLPLLEMLLEAPFESAGDNLKTALKLHARSEVARHLFRAHQLRALVHALRDGGVAALSLKGLALSALLHPDAPERRPCTDIDLLVRPHDVLAARDILLGLGYSERLPMPIGLEHRCIATGKETTFEREGRPNIDLHWRLTRSYGPLGSANESLWERATSIRVEGFDVPVLSPEDHLIFLCVHGCNHAWSRLRWIVDVGMFASGPCAPNWNALAQRAQFLGCRHFLTAGLNLAERLLGAARPSEASTATGTNLLGRSAVRWYMRHLFTPDRPIARRAWLVLLRQGLSGRLRESAGALLTPSENEWAALRAPVLAGASVGLRRILLATASAVPARWSRGAQCP